MSNILVTGAAGYIGGSVLTELLSRKSGVLADSKLFAIVRSQDQADIISKIDGVSVSQIDILDEKAVEDYVNQQNIDLIVNTASSINQGIVKNLLHALSKRRAAGAKDLSFVHTSVSTAFTKENGWPFGEIRDDGPVIEKEKEIDDQHPLRNMNIFVADYAKSSGIKTYNVAVPQTYGKGTGLVKQVSVSLPAYVRNSLKNKFVYEFDQDGKPHATHVTDLANMYALLVENIVKHEAIPSDEKGIYFALAHRMSWWEVKTEMAKNLYARGLIDEPEKHTWPSYEQAADELGLPRAHIRAMSIASGEQIPINAYKLGWKPKWTETDMMERLDEDIQACLDLDTGSLSLYDTLLKEQS